jgi:hypothetical protein
MKRRVALLSHKLENRISELLLSSHEEWMPASELAEISCHYGRAIDSLRRRGVRIENKHIIEAGVQYSFYRLKPTLRLIKRQSTAGQQLSLFSSAELEQCAQRWMDPEEQTG